MKTLSALAFIALASGSAVGWAQETELAEDRPNVIVIVADDLGFSDLGSFGGEISTPNLDGLAGGGLRATNFYVGPTCSVTRSMLLTGLDNHLVGLGNMYERTAPNQLELPGYEGVLDLDTPTISEQLQDAGYRTYMTGKWHLGHEPERLPHSRGFDRTFTLLNGGGSHFDMTGANMDNELSEFTEDGKYLTELPKNFYSTRTYTEKMIEFIESDLDSDQPFFAYLAYQAPHDPLQVPDDWLRRYLGTYDYGWDFRRVQRMRTMQQMGLMPATAEIAPRLWFVPEFADLTAAAQVVQARKMEIYASMVEYIDMQIGNLIEFLDESGELDNTVIIFLSDNGAEGGDRVAEAKQRPNILASNFYANDYDTQFEAWGRSYSFLSYGPSWAQVSATPFNYYKGALAEGGIRSPLIVWDGRDPAGGTINTDAILQVKDIPSTLADLAGIEIAETQGTSWVPMLEGQVTSPRSDDDIIAMEFQTARMIRRGQWKALWMPSPFGVDDWQLFNIVADPAEQNDLSEQEPQVRQELIAAWDEYAEQNNVIIGDRSFYDGMEERLPPRPPVLDTWPRGQEPNYSTGNQE